MPKNYDPKYDPDPERWLPRKERTGYRRTRKERRKGEKFTGAQGIVPNYFFFYFGVMPNIYLKVYFIIIIIIFIFKVVLVLDKQKLLIMARNLLLIKELFLKVRHKLRNYPKVQDKPIENPKKARKKVEKTVFNIFLFYRNKNTLYIIVLMTCYTTYLLEK